MQSHLVLNAAQRLVARDPSSFIGKQAARIVGAITKQRRSRHRLDGPGAMAVAAAENDVAGAGPRRRRRGGHMALRRAVSVPITSSSALRDRTPMVARDVTSWAGTHPSPAATPPQPVVVAASPHVAAQPPAAPTNGAGSSSAPSERGVKRRRSASTSDTTSGNSGGGGGSATTSVAPVAKAPRLAAGRRTSRARGVARA